jgi:hypothetical protein
MADDGAAIRLYDGIDQDWFSAEAVSAHLTEWLAGSRCVVREDLLAHGLAHVPAAEAEALAEQLCRCRVLSPTQGPRARKPLTPEIGYELRVLAGHARATPGVVYDGNELQRIAFALLPVEERALETIHIWFTERLFATLDEDDRRYHARVSVYGHPSLISTSGMVHAPARGREHYLARRLGLRQPVDGSDFLRPEDPRTTRVAEGYAMQAAAYALLGDPFCNEPTCRLFNAHWQAEMLTAQLGQPDYCARHKAMIRDMWPGQDRGSHDG